MANTQRVDSSKIHISMPRKIHPRYRSGRAQVIKVRYLVAILAVLAATLVPRTIAQAENCPDVRLVFARGSGGERWNDQNYLAFKSALETKLATTKISYEFIDLDYPAVAVGPDNLETTIGAYIGAGEAYEFGESVKTGANNLKAMINNDRCANTKYAIGGYSQGAMVISQAVRDIKPEKLIYAATFGDPKIYLPEGEGLIPAACRGANLSDYRMYVPDCQAYKGLLGAYIPYEPEALIGKMGTWCNKRDVFCSSRLSISDHTGYVADNLYEDASRVIYDKITKAFGVENHISSPHDTAILIDSTGSMASMIEQYKAEAKRLAQQTLDSGGRVALYDYRDLNDPYQPVKHCDFDTCTMEVFEAELNKIKANNGGDTPESLMSASLHVMKDLEWKYGSTKSLVVLTDADFLSPDRDGATFDEVVALSKRIDPVNFYIITNEYFADSYVGLASATDGKVVTNFDELNLLTDFIMERYDSLPRVEEDVPVEKPTIEIVSTEQISESKLNIKFTTNGTRTLVVLNDAILGITEEQEITLDNLDRSVENTIKLIPLGDDVRGDGVETTLSALHYGASGNSGVVSPKAPNSGRQ